VSDLIERHTILAVVVGSRAYGLDGPGSDHDRRGVFAARPHCPGAWRSRPPTWTALHLFDIYRPRGFVDEGRRILARPTER